jgi:hypothetical protein
MRARSANSRKSVSEEERDRGFLGASITALAHTVHESMRLRDRALRIEPRTSAVARDNGRALGLRYSSPAIKSKRLSGFVHNLIERDFDFGIAARRGGIHRGKYSINVAMNGWPLRIT